MNNIRRVSFKVFLTEFPDLKAPKEYTPEYIQELFFGHSTPEKSPAPDHPIVGSSIYQYFASQTDFNLISWGLIPHPLRRYQLIIFQFNTPLSSETRKSSVSERACPGDVYSQEKLCH